MRFCAKPKAVPLNALYILAEVLARKNTLVNNVLLQIGQIHGLSHMAQDFIAIGSNGRLV